MDIKILNKIDLNSVVYVSASIDGKEEKIILIYDNEPEDIIATKIEKILKDTLGIEYFYRSYDYGFYFTTSWRPHLKGTLINKVPDIRENNECLIKKLEEKGISYYIDGKSGFTSRNRVIIDDQKYQPKKIKIKSWEWESDWDVRDTVGPLVKKEGRDTYPKYGFRLMSKEMEVDSYKNLQTLIRAINNGCEKEYEKTVAAKYGNIINGIEFGPYEEFDYIPKNYVEVFSTRTKNTADYRQNHTHTYRIWAVRKGTEGAVTLTGIPDEYKGKIIGRGGKKIKEICKKIGCKKIVLK